jgi:hypothetical protein
MIDAVSGLEIGESIIIDAPSNLLYFRKYLTEHSKAQGKKFTTKLIGGKLHLMRVKYSNIYSKEIE